MSRKRPDRAKSDLQQLLEFKHGAPLEALLSQHFERGLDFDAVGEILGISGQTVRRWAKELGFRRRSVYVPPTAPLA